jgi:hypothetical protein
MIGLVRMRSKATFPSPFGPAYGSNLRYLDESGILALHGTNRFPWVAPVVAEIARAKVPGPGSTISATSRSC